MKTKKITFWGFFQSKKTRLNGFCFLTELRKEEKSINLAKIFLFKKGDWNQSLFMECSFFFFSDQVSVFSGTFFPSFCNNSKPKKSIISEEKEKTFWLHKTLFTKYAQNSAKFMTHIQRNVKCVKWNLGNGRVRDCGGCLVVPRLKLRFCFCRNRLRDRKLEILSAPRFEPSTLLPVYIFYIYYSKMPVPLPKLSQHLLPP